VSWVRIRSADPHFVRRSTRGARHDPIQRRAPGQASTVAGSRPQASPSTLSGRGTPATSIRRGRRSTTPGRPTWPPGRARARNRSNCARETAPTVTRSSQPVDDELDGVGPGGGDRQGRLDQIAEPSAQGLPATLHDDGHLAGQPEGRDVHEVAMAGWPVASRSLTQPTSSGGPSPRSVGSPNLQRPGITQASARRRHGVVTVHTELSLATARRGAPLPDRREARPPPGRTWTPCGTGRPARSGDRSRTRRRS
jgi:hypothetical protein